MARSCSKKRAAPLFSFMLLINFLTCGIVDAIPPYSQTTQDTGKMREKHEPPKKAGSLVAMTRWTIKVGLPVEVTLVTNPTHLLPQVVRKSASILEQLRLGNTSAEIWHWTFNIYLLWVIRSKISKLVIKQKGKVRKLSPLHWLFQISPPPVSSNKGEKSIVSSIRDQ